MNKGNLSELSSFSKACDCGSEHSVKVKNIIFASGGADRLSDMIREIMPLGKVLVLCDDFAVGGLITKCELALKKEGFEVLTHIFSHGDLPTMIKIGELFSYPEDIRVIVSIGCDSVISMAKYFASVKEIKHICVCSEYDTLSAFSSIATLHVNGEERKFVCRYPFSVVYDLDFLLSPKPNEIASLYGYCMSYYLALFDLYFSYTVDSKKYCDFLFTEIEAAVSCVLELSEGLVRGEKQSLVICLDKACRLQIISSMTENTALNQSSSSVVSVLNMLKVSKKQLLKREGELLFFVAKKLIKVYELFVKNSIRDLGFPPDKGLRADKFHELFSADRYEVLRGLDYLQSDSDYKMRQLRLEEYRADLQAFLAGMANPMLAAAKTFKRIYSDLGYALSKSVTLSDLKTAISLAPDMHKGFTCLSLLRDMGLLDSYLK